ncbi:MAG TPA: ankyrin repeat domain-containing protein [Blastocatellia bacterium]|nr:ankyrin repeat domain-containing protein [Blastocatellia bacterium]
MENRLRPVALIVCLLAVLVISWATLAKTQGPSQTPTQTPTQTEAAQRQSPPAQEEAAQPELHRAAQAGDLELLRSRLRQGMNPDERDKAMRTPLMDAVKSDRIEAVRILLGAGANVNATSASGRTPLIEAAEFGRIDSAQLLIASGADLNTSQRGWGTALEAAERMGHNELAETLRRAGARSSGRSVGDTVCVRPWQGNGYCGEVVEVNKTSFRLRVTEIIGCEGGCPAKAECSASRAVGGPRSMDGIQVGDEITTVSWCLTHTGVKP